MRVIDCLHCNESFIPSHFNQKICSKVCATKRNKQQCKKWDQNNKDKKKAYNARKYAENGDHYRNQSFKERYKMSLDEARARVEIQDHKCPICGEFIDVDSPGVNGPNKAHVDHCHLTGQIRDMLCRECNWMLGNGKDDPDRLQSGADYLRKWSNAKS